MRKMSSIKMLVQVERRLKNVLSEINIIIGVLVGKVSTDNAFVLHFIPTPVVEEACDVDGKSGLPFEDWWIEDHVHQVGEILPGGLDVIGLCVVSRDLEENAIFTLSNLSRKYCSTNSYQLPFLIMHFSISTKSFTCQYLSTTPVNAKVTDILLGRVVIEDLSNMFCCLRSSIDVKLEKPIDNMASQTEFVQCTQQTLASGLACLQSGIVVLSNRCCSPSDILGDCVEDKVIQCKLLSKYKVMKYGESLTSDQSLALCIQGTIPVFAYAALRLPVAEASKALYNDILRTVRVRWKKLCEKVVLGRLQAVGKMHLPRRVEVAVEGYSFNFCGYLFEDEKEETVMEHICELVGAKKEIVSIVRWERMLSESLLIKPSSFGYKNRFLRILIVILVVLVIILFFLWKL